MIQHPGRPTGHNRIPRWLILVAFLMLAGLGTWAATSWPRAASPSPTSPPLEPTATPTPRPTVQRMRVAGDIMPLAREAVRPLAPAPIAQLPTTLTLNLPNPFEEVHPRAGEYGTLPLPGIITYTVQPGDTLSSIALRFGLTLDAVRWSNPEVEYNPDDLYPGQVLRLPPLNGIVVEVKEGDTVEKLAKRYNVPPEVIRDYAPNRLRPPYILTPGTLLIIPGGSKAINWPPPRAYPGYTYMWPVRGYITQPFSKRHNGIDIGTIYGAGVYAARSGRVRVARWDDTGYGNMVIIDHGDGWNTLYAHMKGFLVQPGQWVSQGELIGRAGGTGRATGPHVHFEVRKGRTRYNPMNFLPPKP